MKHHQLGFHFQCLSLVSLLHLLIHPTTAKAESSTSPLQVEINGEPMEQMQRVDKDTLVDIDGRPMAWTMSDEGAEQEEQHPVFLRIDHNIPIKNATIRSPDDAGARCFFWLSDHILGDGTPGADPDAITVAGKPVDRDDLAPLVRLPNGERIGTFKSPVFGHGQNIPSTLNFDDDKHVYYMLVCYQAKDDDVVVFFQQQQTPIYQRLTVVRVPLQHDRFLSELRERSLTNVLQASIIESPDPAIECRMGESTPSSNGFVYIGVDQPSKEIIPFVDFITC